MQSCPVSAVPPSLRSRHLVPAEAVLDVTWGILLIRVVLVVLAVVLVVEVLGALLGLVLGLLAVPSILAFGLGETVNLTTGETGDHLLGELVVDWLACVVVSAWFCEAGTSILLTLLALLVFEHLHRHE
jgi:hypothetical protein